MRYKSIWKEERQDTLLKILKEVLPSGSGIDAEWEFTLYKNGKIKASNYFHAMNEHGSYTQWMPFSVTFEFIPFVTFPKELNPKKIVVGNIKCNEKKHPSFYGLKDYLDDTIVYLIQEWEEN